MPLHTNYTQTDTHTQIDKARESERQTDREKIMFLYPLEPHFKSFCGNWYSKEKKNNLDTETPHCFDAKLGQNLGIQVTLIFFF